MELSFRTIRPKFVSFVSSSFHSFPRNIPHGWVALFVLDRIYPIFANELPSLSQGVAFRACLRRSGDSPDDVNALHLDQFISIGINL